jgi:arginine/lysine/ornithine decarboxylase
MKHAPLYEALMNHIKRTKWSFHVPGHKGGLLFEETGAPFFKSVLPLDVTELAGLDDLHHPEGPILEAQRLLASFYNVHKSFFLVGGSTSGNHAMILSSFTDGDLVFVQRNCHKSVLNGLELAGVTPVFLQPEWDEEGGYPLGISCQTVEQAVEMYPESKGIILTNPTYYGLQKDIKDIAELIHRIGGIVLVDEAHGAHFGLEGMPESSIHKGADIVVQSAHKTLPALTMGAFLHVNSKRVDIQRLSHALQMFQSSSPSYLIMASLDLTRLYLENLSEKDIQKVILQTENLKQFIDSVPNLKVADAPKGYRSDPLKVTVKAEREISGYELQRLFEEEELYTELADDRNVLFVLPLGSIHEMAKLQKVFIKVSGKLSHFKEFREMDKTRAVFQSISKLELSYREMNRLKVKPIPIKDAEGLIAGEAVIPYPPGIPLIAKGEQITSEHIHLYSSLKKKGARFQGTGKHDKMFVFDKT